LLLLLVWPLLTFFLLRLVRLCCLHPVLLQRRRLSVEQVLQPLQQALLVPVRGCWRHPWADHLQQQQLQLPALQPALAIAAAHGQAVMSAAAAALAAVIGVEAAAAAAVGPAPPTAAVLLPQALWQ
jgi:hypothetical protein